MNFIEELQGFLIFNQESGFCVKLDTPDGLIPVISSLVSVESAREFILAMSQNQTKTPFYKKMVANY